MNKSEKELLEEMYRYYRWKSFLSGRPATQRAHIIGNTKPNRKRFGSSVIDSIYNWLPVADLEENALVDAGKNFFLLKSISDFVLSGNRAKIEEVVLENVSRKKSKIRG